MVSGGFDQEKQREGAESKFNYEATKSSARA